MLLTYLHIRQTRYTAYGELLFRVICLLSLVVRLHMKMILKVAHLFLYAFNKYQSLPHTQLSHKVNTIYAYGISQRYKMGSEH